MKILTLRIAKQAGDQLSFIPLSIDPSERINHPTFYKQLNNPLDQIRRNVRQNLSKSLEHASEVALVSVGEYLKRELWPDELSDELAKTSASMVYLDLEEDLIDIPWECVRIDGEAWLGSRFVVGRHVRIASGKEPRAEELNKKFVIISDPDGTLPAAQAEGASLVKALGNDQNVTLLNSQVSKGEAAEYIKQCRVFHYAGHSSEHGLHFSDGILTPADIYELDLRPRLAFLNSCESGHTRPAESRLGAGIVQAFLTNGTLGVICTNGLVNSATSAAIADRFYAEFLAGQALGPSFAAAVKASENRVDWARYTIYGNPLFDLKKPFKPRIPLAKLIGPLVLLTMLILGISGF